jgi:anaerobic magnesium-protoporphyrin IX monomethyl ester cyclase
MKIGFYVQAFEHLSVERLSAGLKCAGHEIEVFVDPKLCNDGIVYNERLRRLLNIEDLLIEDMLNANLDLVGFSVVTDNYATALRVAGKLKAQTDILTVFGGIHATSVPERVIKRPEVDYLVVGEGDEAMVELANALANGDRDFSFPNLWFRKGGEVVSNPVRPPIADLDILPFPDKGVYYKKVPAFHRRRYSIVASRGCIYACTFCNNSMYKRMYRGLGRWQRRRSVDNVIAELQQAYEKYPFETVQFWDEIFVDHMDWLEEFSDKYAQTINKPFYCCAYPKYVTPETVAMLEKANCREVNFGIQTINETTKRTKLRRGESTEQVTKAVQLIRDSSIFLSTGNILEIPGQSVEEALELVEFYNENRVDLPYVGFMRYYPRTEIVDIGLAEGVLTPEDVERIEEAAEEGGFLKATGQDTKLYVKMRSFIQLTSFMPKWSITLLLRTGWWRLIPGVDLYNVLFRLAYHTRRIWTRKKRFVENYTLPRYLQTMLLYAFRKIRWKLSGRRGGASKMGTKKGGEAP